MRLNTSRRNLELSWQLSSSSPFLSCREIARLTKVSVQTSANHRALGQILKAKFPRLRLWKLSLVDARRVRGRRRSTTRMSRGNRCREPYSFAIRATSAT